MAKEKIFGVKIEQEDVDRLQVAAALEGYSMSDLVRNAIKKMTRESRALYQGEFDKRLEQLQEERESNKMGQEAQKKIPTSRTQKRTGTRG